MSKDKIILCHNNRGIICKVNIFLKYLYQNITHTNVSRNLIILYDLFCQSRISYWRIKADLWSQYFVAKQTMGLKVSTQSAIYSAIYMLSLINFYVTIHMHYWILSSGAFIDNWGLCKQVSKELFEHYILIH